MEPKAHGSPFFADLSLATQRKSGAPGTGLKTIRRAATHAVKAFDLALTVALEVEVAAGVEVEVGVAIEGTPQSGIAPQQSRKGHKTQEPPGFPASPHLTHYN